MTTFEWRPFDYDNRKETAPPKHDQLVWIHEEHYHGVTFGYYDHGGWWCTYWGSDDCHVTHWAPIEYPDAPEVPEEEDEDEEDDDEQPGSPG